MRSKDVIHICNTFFGKKDYTAKHIVKCIELSSQKKRIMRSKDVINMCNTFFGKNDQTSKHIVKRIELSSQKENYEIKRCYTHM